MINRYFNVYVKVDICEENEFQEKSRLDNTNQIKKFLDALISGEIPTDNAMTYQMVYVLKKEA